MGKIYSNSLFSLTLLEFFIQTIREHAKGGFSRHRHVRLTRNGAFLWATDESAYNHYAFIKNTARALYHRMDVMKEFIFTSLWNRLFRYWGPPETSQDQSSKVYIILKSKLAALALTRDSRKTGSNLKFNNLDIFLRNIYLYSEMMTGSSSFSHFYHDALSSTSGNFKILNRSGAENDWSFSFCSKSLWGQIWLLYLYITFNRTKRCPFNWFLV